MVQWWKLAAGMLLVGCTGEAPMPAAPSDRCVASDLESGIVRPDGWKSATHCKFTEPDYASLFGDDDEVKVLRVHLTRETRRTLEDDFDDLQGGPGPGGPGPQIGPEEFAICADSSLGDACSTDNIPDGECMDVGLDGEWLCLPTNLGGFPGGPGPVVPDGCAEAADGEACSMAGLDGVCESVGPEGFRSCAVRGVGSADVSFVPDDAAAGFFPRNPVYVRVELEMDGVRWTDVGYRYKGNNGLAQSVPRKRPFRLKLDHFEDETPAIDDQRMFGFRELSFASNGTDPSFLNQHTAARTFVDQNLAAPATTPIEVIYVIDGEERPARLYTLTEIPNAPLLDLQFGDSDGNLYKPDGRGAHLTEFVEASFHKKTNLDSDYGDVQAFIDALNSPEPDPSAWRAELESAFDMPSFISFMALNQAIGNWDTYGGIAHNYYLYAPPDQPLTFVPWDFDLAFAQTGPSDLTLTTFGGEWPLIQAIVHDPTYYYLYHQELGRVYDDLFENDQLLATVDRYAAAVSDAASRDGEAGHPQSVAQLREHVMLQKTAIENHLVARGFTP